MSDLFEAPGTSGYDEAMREHVRSVAERAGIDTELLVAGPMPRCGIIAAPPRKNRVTLVCPTHGPCASYYVPWSTGAIYTDLNCTKLMEHGQRCVERVEHVWSLDEASSTE